MRFSFAVLIVAASVCLADVVSAEERLKDSSSASRSRRMVGGTLAPHVPWQALLSFNRTFRTNDVGSAALISDRWLLTSANLLIARDPHHHRLREVLPKVYLGIRDRSEANESNEVAVDKVVFHPRFQNVSAWDNNLALLRLRKPVAISDKIVPIPLPERDQDVSETGDETGAIAGWGLGALLTPASSLKHLILPVANFLACRVRYGVDPLRPYIDEHMFCTQPSKYGENVCLGDGGGAFAMKDKKGEDVYAAGILSYGSGCNENLAVYMKISSYLPWIHAVIRGDTAQSSTLRHNAISEMYSRQP